ncbi:MAG TPA: zinc-ribbon domain-containing protein [Polyangiaceae bacterium]|nr:zinc-ribbon domain-containing protein [Polyangiaceae bacterium]
MTTCNACGSNYAIADEKVSGRLVKVRCKSCGAAIVVDARVQALAAGAAAPSQAAPASQGPAAPAVTDAAADTWSVNLSESDSRTMTVPEIVAAHGLGQLGDAYVWKDGMDDWAPLRSRARPALAAAIEAAPRAPAAPATSAAAPARSAEASPLPRGPAGARAATEAAATRSAATRPRQAPDLFGGVAQAGSEEDARRAQPPEEEHQRPVGARNENSVLFSLDALRAGVTAAAPAAAAPGRAAPMAPGRAETGTGARMPGLSDDPFGLGAAAPLPAFDPSANLALMNAPPPPEPKPEPRRPRVVEAAAAEGAAPSGPSRRMLLVAVAGTALGTLAIVGVVLAIVLGRGSPTEVAQATSASAPTAEREKPTATTSTTDTGAAVAATTEAATATDTGTGTATETAAAEPQKPLTPEEKKKLDEALAKKRAEDAKAKAEADAAAAEAKKKEAEKKEAAAVASGFDKGAASAALTSAASAATSCKRPDGPTGSGRVMVTFAPSGRVTTANVTGGAFGGTSVGSCIASVFRSARVPPFEGAPVTVSKSFNIP